jgi:hypothetical protein
VAGTNHPVEEAMPRSPLHFLQRSASARSGT